MTSATALVVDASAVVAALADDGPDGTWARSLLGSRSLAAPHLMPVEATSALRRAAHAGALSADVAVLALADLLDLRVALFPFDPFGVRTWELRAHVTSYDAWYVALAEHLGSPLATLDQRLANAPGVRCQLLTPADA